MSKKAQWTDEYLAYENIAKSNGLNIDNAMVNFICDVTTMNEQKIEVKVKTDKQNKIIEKLKDKNEFKLHIKEKYGSFYFSYYNELLEIIQPQFITRFLYLSCYMNYDNVLVINKITRHIPIYEEDLRSILKLGKTETYATKNTLVENGLLIINEDGTMSINSKYCKKGDIVKNNKSDKVRIFDCSVKELYEKATPKEHKKIALLFKLLPYINLRWNVICSNVEEELKERVSPYTMKDTMNLLGLTNITRFKNDLLSLTVGGEPVVMIILVRDKSTIVINPKVYYKGVNLNELKVIEDDIDMTVLKHINI